MLVVYHDIGHFIKTKTKEVIIRGVSYAFEKGLESGEQKI